MTHAPIGVALFLNDMVKWMMTDDSSEFTLMEVLWSDDKTNL